MIFLNLVDSDTMPDTATTSRDMPPISSVSIAGCGLLPRLGPRDL